jgi:hypothetical protein
VSNFLIQSTYGTAGNFEAVVPGPGGTLGPGGLVHVWRNNDDPPTLPWTADGPFLTILENIGGVALIQSNTATPNAIPGYPGNLEIIVVANGELLHFWRNPATMDWIADLNNPIASGVSGWPAIIQSSFGTVGNFEVVVPLSNGGLQHFWCNNDFTGQPWSATTPFAQVINGINQQWQGVSLIQSSFGNLEVIATPVVVAGGQVSHFWRDSNNNWNYNSTSDSFGDSITGTASLIQSNFGSGPTGDFEVVAPFNFVQAFVHWWRNNNAAGFPWATTGSFTKGGPGEGPPGPYASMGLIQSSIDNSLVAAAYPSNVPLPGGLDIYIRTGAVLFEFSTTALLEGP